LDGRYGREALFAASKAGLWIARPVERTGTRPLEFESGPDGTAPGSLGAALVEWPVEHVIKCLAFYHPDDEEALRLRQERELMRAQDACRRLGRELLVEIIAGKHGSLGPDTIPRILERLYTIGLKPDWWKLEPQRNASAWAAIQSVVEQSDPFCRGIVMLGLDAPASELVAAFEATRAVPLVKGFAIGRTIFIDPARDWMSGRITDAQAVDIMAERFASLVEAWHGVDRTSPADAMREQAA
jgi:5-dehydro-2-deoxygluconokinase